MNRRNFLSLFSAGVAGLALEQAIPLGRVWSFPKKIVIPPRNVFLKTEWVSMETLRIWKRNLQLSFEIGDIVSFPAFGPELYAVSNIDDDGTIEIFNRGVKGIVAPSAVRGLRPYQLTAAFPPDNSRIHNVSESLAVPPAPRLPGRPVEIGTRLPAARRS
jgi:hypothetical protein